MPKLGPETSWLDMRTGCGYDSGPKWDATNECGAPATLHVMLPDGDDVAHVLACTAHEQAALAMPHLDQHPVGTWCPMPGSLWIPGDGDGDSHCVLDGSADEPALVGMASQGQPA